MFSWDQGSESGSSPAPVGAIKAVGQFTAPLCPEGACENSPAFQRRVSGPKEQLRPEGTAGPKESSQSSLRDDGPSSGLPGVETPGYCQMSLRDKTSGAGARRSQSHRAQLPCAAARGPDSAQITAENRANRFLDGVFIRYQTNGFPAAPSACRCCDLPLIPLEEPAFFKNQRPLAVFWGSRVGAGQNCRQPGPPLASPLQPRPRAPASSRSASPMTPSHRSAPLPVSPCVSSRVHGSRRWSPIPLAPVVR